jgi:hypothetical protein
MSENTLIVFTSDNGGERFSNTWPFVGQKMDLLEGGIRVPLLARWPARMTAGAVCDTPSLTMDWSATFLAAAGVDAHADYPLDGISLLPLMQDQSWMPERDLAWRMKHREQKALIRGDWKYLQIEGIEYLFTSATTRASAPICVIVSPGNWPSCAAPGSTGIRSCRRFPRKPRSRWCSPRQTCPRPASELRRPQAHRPADGLFLSAPRQRACTHFQIPDWCKTGKTGHGGALQKRTILVQSVRPQTGWRKLRSVIVKTRSFCTGSYGPLPVLGL